ncbi:IS66 family transposase [Methylobacterium oryzae]|nr:IS66 family transposase [Methylobacterium oryzae]
MPRVECLVDIDSTACPCCSGALHRIGEDVSERLDVVPAQFRMLVIRRPRYACRACGDAIVQAPMLARLIESGLPTDALIAQVLVSKYADRLPLYRQAQIFARQGVSLDRSTLADWVGHAAFLLRPVHERLLETLVHGQAVCRRDHGTGARAGPRPHQDRPALGVCARRPALGRDGSARRRLRVRARPHSRRPIAHLCGFVGVLQVDGYAAYESLAKGGAVRLAYCWSHVRRPQTPNNDDAPQPSRFQTLPNHND